MRQAETATVLKTMAANATGRKRVVRRGARRLQPHAGVWDVCKRKKPSAFVASSVFKRVYTRRSSKPRRRQLCSQRGRDGGEDAAARSTRHARSHLEDLNSRARASRLRASTKRPTALPFVARHREPASVLQLCARARLRAVRRARLRNKAEPCVSARIIIVGDIGALEAATERAKKLEIAA